jgi:hypothetical protein
MLLSSAPSQYQALLPQIPDLVIIAKPYEDLPLFIFTSLSAPADWLEHNGDTAAATCAAVLKGSIELTSSPEKYVAAGRTFIVKPPSDDILKGTYNLIVKYGMWNPSNSMNPKAIDFMTEVAKISGLTKETPAADDLLDMKTYQAALSLLPKIIRTRCCKQLRRRHKASNNAYGGNYVQIDQSDKFLSYRQSHQCMCQQRLFPFELIGFNRQSQVRQTAQQRHDSNTCFQTGQRCTHTVMDTVAEGNMLVGRSRNVECIRIN